MKKLKIGVDFDDVLFEFNYGFMQYYNSLYGTTHKKEDIKDYQLHILVGGTKEDIFDLIDTFYSSGNHGKVMPVLGAVENMAHLEPHELFLISARPEQTRDAVNEWLDKHFPGLFKNIYLTGLYRGVGVRTQTKEGLALSLNLDIFIEDAIKQALKISEAGIPVLLIDTPWNQGELPVNVTRVYSWEEIAERIKKLAQ